MTCWPISIDHSLAAHLGYPKSGFLVCPHAISEHEFPGILYRQFMPSKSCSIPPKHSDFLWATLPIDLHNTSDVPDQTIKYLTWSSRRTRSGINPLSRVSSVRAALILA
jgi:hypothetical protein